MKAIRRLLERLGQLSESPRALAALAISFLVIAAIFLLVELRDERLTIRISAGDPRGRRADVARALAVVCARRGLDVEIVAAMGSEQALDQVEENEIDVALVQGGLHAGEDVREIAPLTLEPLHLLVRRDAYDLEDLAGLRINLSPPRSGTRDLALDLLHLAHLRPGHDFEETTLGYQELEELPAEQLPDAIFHVSALPSPVARFLVEERGYRIMPLPFADAMALRDVAISRGVIPAYTYGASPPMPRGDVPTLATRMLLVGHRRTPDEVVRRILESIETEDFARMARIPHADERLFGRPEMPLHAGTVEWLHRNDPVLTSEGIQGVESLRSFLVSLIVAGVLAYRWWRRKKLHGLDAFIAEVSTIDREALVLEREARLDLAKLLALRARLGEAKTRALEAFQRGAIHSEELLSSFLAHVSDVRSHLNAMILHERDRREKAARASGADEEQVLRELWAEALAEEHEDRETTDRRSRS